MSHRTDCKVKSDGSVCLKDILSSFSSPIREEHAWALCYQCAKYFDGCLKRQQQQQRGPIGCYVSQNIQHFHLQTDGNVHENTTKNLGDPSHKLRTETEVIGILGLIIYDTLSQGIENGEERAISEDLEILISQMIPDDHSHHETDDEGIERDSEENSEAVAISNVAAQITFEEIMRRCEDHLGNLTKTQAEAHYKAVVRAFVAEALELSTFLEKVKQGAILLPPNNAASNLDFADWANFWMQVMSELRTGVKLKKVNYSKAPIEYELTPYEILMKDIRNCRYNLKKIMINGDVPSRVTKDAHEIILEFIRSRPPLKKASERKLPAPPTVSYTPREQLLNSIRKGRKLRPTPSPRTKLHSTNTPVDEPISPIAQPRTKKLIKVDFSQLDDDDENDISNSESPDCSEPGLWSTEYAQICEAATESINLLEPYDLAVQDVGSKLNLRRHTLGVYETNLGSYSVPQSRPGSRQSYNSSEAEMEPETAKQIQDELIDAKTWENSLSLDERLSLTLSEIVHVRSVLTKAELDALPVEGRIRHDVEARKVCFLCLKTRFGIFGPWGHRCALCKRTVCSKCCAKMNVPIEHFSTVPIVLMSPSIMATPVDEHSDSFTKSLMSKMMENESGSASVKNSPSSPNNLENLKPGGGGIMESSVSSEPGSGTIFGSKFRTKASRVKRAVNVVDRLRSSNQSMVVCQDCKRMVLQIIKSARANRAAIRNRTIQNMTLNLSPIFPT